MLAFTWCVFLGKSLPLAVGLFPHLNYGAKNSPPSTLTGKFMKVNEIACVKVCLFLSGRHWPGEGHCHKGLLSSAVWPAQQTRSSDQQQPWCPGQGKCQQQSKLLGGWRGCPILCFAVSQRFYFTRLTATPKGPPETRSSTERVGAAVSWAGRGTTQGHSLVMCGKGSTQPRSGSPSVRDINLA